MLKLPPSVRIYFAVDPVDLRGGHDGLSDWLSLRAAITSLLAGFGVDRFEVNWRVLVFRAHRPGEQAAWPRAKHASS